MPTLCPEIRHRAWLVAVLSWAAVGCVPGGDITSQGVTPASQQCAKAGCSSHVQYQTTVSVPLASVTQLEAKLCWNSICATRQVYQPAQSASGYSCEVAGVMQTSCQLTPSGGGLLFAVSFLGPSSEWKDGDLFTIELGVPGQAPLVKVQKAAVYKTTQPNGPGCEPTCFSASLN